MLNKLLIILLIIPFRALFAQDIPIGDWRDHLPYSDAVSISFGNGVIYCATNSALFTYDKSDMTIDRLNLVNGLSDIGLSKINWNGYNGKVVIGYKNGNLDVIDQDKTITNLSFIKESGIIGSKSINHIYFQGKLAYLSTGFGIVVLDTDKLEIVETYLFGPLGAFMETNAVTFDNTNIYAATTQGVYFANKNSTNLFDFNVWSLLPDLGSANYSSIVMHANLLFATSESAVQLGDTLYYNNAGVWQKFLTNGYNILNLNVSQNKLIFGHYNTIDIFDASLTNTTTITTFKNMFNIFPNEVVIDDENYLLIAEESHGIVRMADNLNGEIITPNGPSSSGVVDMDFYDDELWVASGGFDPQTFSPRNVNRNLMNHKIGDLWEKLDEIVYNANGTIASDVVSIAINPSNKAQVFMGAWDYGLFELSNGIVVNRYTAQNSELDSTTFGSTKIGGMAFDANNNLWMSNSFANGQLAVRTTDNNLYGFSFPGMGVGDVVTKIIVDQNNYKWVVAPWLNSVLVFDDNNTISDKSDDRFKLNGNIPGAKMYSIVEDLDGEIWVGSDNGIAVFYNPAAVFDENITAEPIFIQQDGQTQLLLDRNIITALAVDGANRKWIGTQNSGVFLMSEDGTEEIEHFTQDNSPLFSNNILEIVINPKTGEVYFGTDKGLLSYKGTATEADSDFNNIFVYPNPVKPDFTGTIAIRGLVEDTDVRITDISGNIVYQTTSLGGQAIWDGKDFNGNKVHTGVYIIFNGSPDGELKAAAKILFIH